MNMTETILVFNSGSSSFKFSLFAVQDEALILSGIAEMDSKIRSFGFGADDYMTKPFSLEELVARLRDAVPNILFQMLLRGANAVGRGCVAGS